jgi:nitroreductase
MRNDTVLFALTVEENHACKYPVHNLLAQRRSSRAFSSRPVAMETLGSLLEAARWAPSSMNEQPWSFIVATQQNKAEFDRLLGCLLEFNIRWAQHAPMLVMALARTTFTANSEPNRHAFYDVGQAVANLTFQAIACGLTVCQMAGFDVHKARHTFAIPPHQEPMIVAAIGYRGSPESLPEKLRQKELTPQKRRSLDEFVFESEFGQPASWTQTRS